MVAKTNSSSQGLNENKFWQRGFAIKVLFAITFGENLVTSVDVHISHSFQNKNIFGSSFVSI